MIHIALLLLLRFCLLSHSHTPHLLLLLQPDFLPLLETVTVRLLLLQVPVPAHSVARKSHELDVFENPVARDLDLSSLRLPAVLVCCPLCGSLSSS